MAASEDDHGWALGFVSAKLQAVASWPDTDGFAARDAAYAAARAAAAAAAAEHWKDLCGSAKDLGLSSACVVSGLLNELIDCATSRTYWNEAAEALAAADHDIIGVHVTDPVAVVLPFLDGHEVDEPEPTAKASGGKSDDDDGGGGGGSGPIADPNSMFTYSAAGASAVEDHLLQTARMAGISVPLVARPTPDDAIAALWPVVRDELGVQEALTESLGGKPVSVVQVEVYKQMHNAFCGYYMLTNTAGLVAALLAGPASAVGRGAISRLSNAAHSWQSYAVTRARLLSYLAEKGDELWFPWEAKAIQSGSMERAHVQYLMTQMLTPRAVARLAAAHIQIVYLSDVALLLKGVFGEQRLAALSKVFDTFHNQASSAVVVCLGLATHWVTIGVTKSGDADGVRLYMLNSLNSPVLGKDDAGLWEVCLDAADSRWFREGKRYEYGRLLLYLQMMADCQAALSVLASLAIGELSVFDHWIDGGLGSVLDSFESRAWPLAPLALPPPADAVVVLEAWLSSYFPPKIIEEIALPRLAALAASSRDELPPRLVAFYASIRTLADTSAYGALAAASPALPRLVETLDAMAEAAPRLDADANARASAT